MNCQSLSDKMLEISEGRRPTLVDRLSISLHLLICPQCIEKMARFDLVRDIIRHDFLPAAPFGLAEVIMARIAREDLRLPDSAVDFWVEKSGEFTHWKILREVTFRNWVITGFVILFSLATSFLGLDFIHIAASQGSSFLVPVGITVGVFVTGYGALFIGSHLKELSERFGL